jgi:hypothetical protein
VAVAAIVARLNPPRRRPAMFRRLRKSRHRSAARDKRGKLGKLHRPRHRTNRNFSFTHSTPQAGSVK